MIVSGNRIDGESGFVYNKDAGRYICPAGHLANRMEKRNREKEGRSSAIRYRWNPNVCAICPIKDTCLRPGAKSKSYVIQFGMK